MSRKKSDYAAGYGKPPEHTRFRPGQSGNPKGRPRGSLNLATALNKALNETVVIVENGRRRSLNDKRTGAIVIIMQRLHLHDLVGHVLEKGEAWEVVNLPAIAQEDETWHYATPWGEQTYRRSEGDVLHPAREPKTVLDAVRKALGEYAFSAQYLQSPVPLGGGLVKREWVHFYEESYVPGDFPTVVQSWDTANKSSELADYSVCTTWGIRDKKAYLLHVLRDRMTYPDLKRKVVEHAKLWNAKTVLIEDKASGTQLIQELVRDGLSAVKGIKPTGDKEMRLRAQTAHFENGYVLLPERAPWLEIYLLELTTFPQSRYAVQVDSTSQALEWISVGKRNDGILVYYREPLEAERRAGRLPPA